MITKEYLKELGERGVIPGPEESEEAFIKRLDIFEKLKKTPEIFLKGKTFEAWKPNYLKTLGAKPDWIPLIYSNKGLLPWQGAVFWIFEGKEKIPMIQLNKRFKQGKFLLYSEEEVLQHETMHALRLAFEEPRFEEILAYTLSQSKWRRFFGPLFRKPSQTLFFITLIIISLIIQTSSFLFLSSPFFQLFSFLPLVDLIFRGAVLIKDQRLLKKALQNLRLVFPNLLDPFPIALRLKDAEIQLFASKSLEQILTYIEENLPLSIRWQQIIAQFC